MRHAGRQAAGRRRALREGELSLYGKVQPRQAPAEYLEEEYGVGAFYRSFAFAAEIDANKIAADYRDGVLAVHRSSSPTS